METSAQSSLTVHPQVESYRRQNRRLQIELARLIGERDELKQTVVPQICAEYQIKIGALRWRVFQLDCEVRAFIRRIEMANRALNRGEQPIYKRIENEIRAEFSAWRERVKEQAREIEAARRRERLPTLNRAESLELQTLYRRLAFLLHPDILKNPDERRRQLWLQTAEAYRDGDLPALKLIFLLIGDETPADGSAVESASVLEILKNRRAELKRSVEKTLAEINEIKTTEPFVWHKILDDAEELARRQNDLRERIADWREKRRQLAEHWAEIMRFAADREDVSIPAEPPDIFADEDDDWAEIIHPL